MAEMDLNHTEKCLRESGVDAESTWLKEGGAALPGPGVVRAEVRGGTCPIPLLGLAQRLLWLQGQSQLCQPRQG